MKLHTNDKNTFVSFFEQGDFINMAVEVDGEATFKQTYTYSSLPCLISGVEALLRNDNDFDWMHFYSNEAFALNGNSKIFMITKTGKVGNHKFTGMLLDNDKHKVIVSLEDGSFFLDLKKEELQVLVNWLQVCFDVNEVSNK